MTLPSLFRKVGIDVPRHVTVNGTVLLDRQAPNGIRPANVTPMLPHRFHGGEDPAPARDNKAGAWWVTDPSAKDADVADMRSRFRDVMVLDDGEDLAYGVTYDTGRGRFETLILPHVDGSLPTVVVTKPKSLNRREGRTFRQPPHMYMSGTICIASTSDWAGKGYATSAAAAWTAHWLACYTEWRMSGVWPTDGYGRDVA